jgi:hypothetical protein
MVLPDFAFLSAISSPDRRSEQDYCLNSAPAGIDRKDLFAVNLYTVDRAHGGHELPLRHITHAPTAGVQTR